MRCWTEVIAPSTDSLLTRDLILEAVPYSSASSLLTRAIWSFGGMIREIILVPFLKVKALLKLQRGELYLYTIYIVYNIYTTLQDMGVCNWLYNLKASRRRTYPRASSKLLINFLIFQISTFLSEESSWDIPITLVPWLSVCYNIISFKHCMCGEVRWGSVWRKCLETKRYNEVQRGYIKGII